MLMSSRFGCSRGWRLISLISMTLMALISCSRLIAFDDGAGMQSRSWASGMTVRGRFACLQVIIARSDSGKDLLQFIPSYYLSSFVSMSKCPKLTSSPSPSFDGLAA